MMFLSMHRSRDDRGSLAPSVAAMIVILFLLGGLIIDGARALGARSRATAYAEEGARIAGQGVTFDQGTLELDNRAVQANAEAYCARISAADDGIRECEVLPDGGDILFRVRLSIDKGMLGMVSTDPTMEFTGEGRAVAEIGISEAQGSADDPMAIESALIEGDPNEVNIDEAAGGPCPPPLLWTSPPVGSEASPFEYYDRLQYRKQKPARCLIPPVCPNADALVVVDRAYKSRPEDIDAEVLRSSKRWEDLFSSCPAEEELLYSFGPRPECELGQLPGAPPTCRPLDLPPCPVGEDAGEPAECNPLDLPTCEPDERPGVPPGCRPLPECAPGQDPGRPPECRKPEEDSR